MTPWGIYVHVPWCRVRCPYCSFYVERDDGPPWECFVDRILEEHSTRRAHFPDDAPISLSLGGGTPSRLPPEALGRLVRGLPVTDEVSVEANPEDVDAAWLESALSAGVTRISLGIQTFAPERARLLNRAHTAPQARRTATRVRDSGVSTWSVDIIFALPGQTLEDLRRDLDAILEVDPPHVSLYGLTFEPGTPFERARRAGRLQPPDDDTWRAMYDHLCDTLEASGRQHYEVSNFALPGHTSAHNRLYWTDRPYMGLGPGAHGYRPDGARWANPPSAEAYLAGHGQDPPSFPSAEEAAIDLVLATLRGREGLSRAQLARRTGHVLIEETVQGLVARGLLGDDGDHLRLTRSGLPVADGITERLVGALRPTVH